MPVQDLKKLAPPPAQPNSPGSKKAWSELESRRGIAYPEDFKELIATYGTGQWTDFFGISNPFDLGSYIYDEWVKMQLSGFKLAKESYPADAVSMPIYPEKGGLYPWGYTDNGGVMCWLITEAKTWPVVCLDDARSKDYDVFELPVTDFLHSWLSGRISVESLTPPDFFPLRSPVFVPK